ncbi:MAG: RluA family pseudouridine synthase [Gemmataceae bacterium]|nr:RluA family pseudouridine synthase [Gemmataceae bacterium]
MLAWLLDVLRPMNRTRVKQLLRHGRISINGTATTRHDHPLRPGDRVAIARARSVVTDRSLEVAGIAIVFEDDALIVIDKPAGLLTVATASEKLDTAFARLNAHLTARGLGRPFVVHRLDRETSGLLLFARSAAVRDRLQANWDKVAKTYLAIVEGKPGPAEGVMENFLIEGRDLRVRATCDREGARWAVTQYRVVVARDKYTLVEVGLETGRKHQIRVHLAGLGCPVIGDPVYGTGSDPAGRLGLHAQRLTLDHPKTGQRLELESPLPVVLRQMVE